MGKVLLFLRTSTEKQEFENQKKEMQDYVKSMGYSEADCVYLEKAGASAIKLDDDYMLMVNQLIEYIDGGEIDCVALWAVDRMLRDDEVWPKIKKKLVAKKIQLVIKNPSLFLLNPDGSINQGSELALSLFATMATQEMRVKKERFKRTKTANAKKGKYNGGCNIRYGYSVNEEGYYIINETEAEIIRTIYGLYSEGKYSAVSLQQELADRGTVLDKGKIMNILSSDAYCGRPQKDWNDRVYPAIISEELFDKCSSIRSENKLITRKGDKLCLGAKLIKCDCGGTFTSNAKAYACCRHSVRKVCDNSITLKKTVIESLLWRIASTLHLEYLMNDNENKIEECRNEIAVIDSKIETAQTNILKIDNKKNRVAELYIDGLIDSENKAHRLAKIQEEYQRLTNELNALNEAKDRLLWLIKNMEDGDDVEAFITALDVLEEDEKKIEQQYNIIHTYITKVECKREWFGEQRDKRATKENGIHIYIHTIFNEYVYEFMYVPNGYKGNKLFVWNKKWVAD
jgi:DNA invertase Pin-like site-specific DNA recombinase